MADGSGKRECDPTCGLAARGWGGLRVAATGGVMATVERAAVARRRRTGAPEPNGEEGGEEFCLRPSVVSELERRSGVERALEQGLRRARGGYRAPPSQRRRHAAATRCRAPERGRTARPRAGERGGHGVGLCHRGGARGRTRARAWRLGQAGFG
jgi:hypothetical protein